MKKIIVLMIMLGVVLGSGSFLFAEGGNCGCSFIVSNPNHDQELGGKSGHASHKGLHQADETPSVVVHSHKGHK